jgi:Uma2 family endonuclease
MSEPYEEIMSGEVWLRSAPGPRHERICARLHGQIAAIVARHQTTKLLPPRSVVQIRTGTLVRPDLALVTSANGRLWLAAEVISSGDHRPDTVDKKAVYEEINIPRLWIIDPRYDNVEVYHGGEYGLALKGILAGRDCLTERLLPEFQVAVVDLFGE